MILAGILYTLEDAQDKLAYAAVRAAYHEAVSLLENKFRGDDKALQLLEAFRQQPESAKDDLEDYLINYNCYDDQEILAAVTKVGRAIQDARHQTPDWPHLFLSYSRNDHELMERISADLSQAEFRVWTDSNRTAGTPSWKKDIQQAIETCGGLVVILSPGAKESEWVEAELDHAKTHGKRIFPILARGDEKTAVPFGVNIAQRIDIRAEASYPSEMQKLTDSIRQHLNSLVGS